MEGGAFPVYKEHLPWWEHGLVELLEDKAPGNDDDDIYGFHPQDVQDVMELLIQQGNLQVGDDIYKGDGEDLGVDQVSSSKEADLQSSVHLVKEQEQETVEGYHQPVSSPPEGELQHLVEMAVPDEPVDPCFQSQDGDGCQ